MKDMSFLQNPLQQGTEAVQQTMIIAKVIPETRWPAHY